MTYITRIKKIVVASAVLIVFLFGAVAMSLAYDSSLDGQVYAISLPHGSNDGLVQSDTYARRIALNCASGDVPRMARPDFQPSRFTCLRIVDPVATPAFVQVHVHKVSLQILQSVLIL